MAAFFMIESDRRKNEYKHSKRIWMRKLILALMTLLFPIAIQAQLHQNEDGKYYDKSNKPYTGTYIEYHPSGGKRIEMSLKEGQKHGKIIIYFENQTTKEVRSFKQDLMDGTWLTYNDKSIKIGEANYLDGLKHGKWYIWDDKGVLRYEMEYNKGVKTGKWTIFDENGKMVSEKVY
jgi:antitoxin component YwqK of YwqJK toxin-antitoxin module